MGFIALDGKHEKVVAGLEDEEPWEIVWNLQRQMSVLASALQAYICLRRVWKMCYVENEEFPIMVTDSRCTCQSVSDTWHDTAGKQNH